MAAGVTIKMKRKAGAFVGGELDTGEMGIDVTNSDVYFSIDGATVTLIDVSAIGGGAGQLSDLSDVGVSTPTDQNFLVADGDSWESRALVEADVSDLGTAATLNADTDVSGNAWVLDEDTLSSDSATKVPTQQSVKAYVDNSVTGLLEYQGGYNAATNTPDLDTSPSGVSKGDTYTVTADGAFFAANVEVGDMLIAEQDDPTLVGHWTLVQANVDGVAVVGDGLDQFAATTSAELAGVISDETGSGLLVFGNSPSIVTPTLILQQGAAPAPTSEGDIQWDTDDNTIKVGDGAGTKTFSADGDLSITESQISDLGTAAAMVADNLSVFAATTSAQLAGVISDETGSGALVFGTAPTLGSPVLDLPQINDLSDDHQYIFAVSELTANRTVTLPLLAASDTFVFEAHIQALTNKTIDLASNTVTGSAAEFDAACDDDDFAFVSDNLSAFAATTSAQLAGVISDETGSGALVFGTSPALGSPVLTTPQINDTSEDHQYVLAVSELTADRTITLPLLTGSDTFVFESHTQTLTNKTLSDSGSVIDGGSI